MRVDPLATVAIGCLAFGCAGAGAADLCVDGLCVVRAQVQATHDWTRYQPIMLIVENRTDRAHAITRLRCSAAERVQVISGDKWDQPKRVPLRLAPHEYRAIDGASVDRLMLIGLKQQLIAGQVIYLELVTSGGNRLNVPVTVI